MKQHSLNIVLQWWYLNLYYLLWKTMISSIPKILLYKSIPLRANSIFFTVSLVINFVKFIYRVHLTIHLSCSHLTKSCRPVAYISLDLKHRKKVLPDFLAVIFLFSHSMDLGLWPHKQPDVLSSHFLRESGVYLLFTTSENVVS